MPAEIGTWSTYADCTKSNQAAALSVWVKSVQNSLQKSSIEWQWVATSSNKWSVILTYKIIIKLCSQ